MSEHPTPKAVAGLLQGRLSLREASTVVAHLLHGCGICAEALWPSVEEDAYEQAIGAVTAQAEARQREWVQAEAWLTTYYLKGRQPFAEYSPRKKRRLATWGLCEVLLKASHALRRDYPEEMVHLAEIAVEVSSLVPFAPFRFDQLCDLEARACGELANAYRVIDDLPRAEKALRRALGRYELGTHDPLLLARLRDIAASLFAERSCFEEAYRALAEARAIFLRAGDRHRAGRALISAGLFAGYDGEPVTAIELLIQGLDEIDRDLDPDLTYRALHNLLLFTVDLGDYEEACRLLTMLQPLASRLGGRPDLAKLCDVEGRIAVGLGDFEGAERAFRAAMTTLEEDGLFYHAAIAGLDLAAVWLRQAKTAAVKGIVGELVTAFSRVQVEREALAALVLLHKAAAQESATLEQIERVQDVLGRLTKRARRRES